MAELKSTRIKEITDNANNVLAVKTCTLRAAKEIELPEANDALREMLLKILNNPHSNEWLAAILWHVVVSYTEISWENLSGDDALEIEAEITVACTSAIYVMAGVVEP